MLGFAQQTPARKTPAQRPQPVAKPRNQKNPIAQVVGHLGVQPKLKLGTKDDPLEQEADRTAERVVNGPEPSSDQLHPVSHLSGQGTATVHRRHQSSHSDGQTDEPGLPERNDPEQDVDEPDLLPEAIHQRIARMQPRGRPLPHELRAYMEPRFGQDFSRVRIHTDGEAAQLSDSIHARAFTLGEHIAFNRGMFQPHSQSGKRLIAHELTHVVQQGGAGPEPILRRNSVLEGAKNFVGSGVDRVRSGAERVTDAAGDVVNSAGEVVRSRVEALLERYSPELKAILDTGPVKWLEGKFSSVFDTLVESVERLTPLNSVSDLSDTFSEMLTKAGTIVQALTSGDCGPLFEAMGELKSFVTRVAGDGWDKLKDFLSPVGDFFSDLWQSTGAPAIEFLSEFGGDLWDDTKALMNRIQRGIEPLKEQGGRAWNWIKEKLFGREDDNRGEGNDGLIDWLKAKAADVWNGIKAKTRRFWQPIQEGVEQLRELAPPAFIKNLGEDMKSLSDGIGEAQQQLGGSGEDQGPGAGLSENREALANALPSVKTVLSRVRAILVGAGGKLTTTLGNLHTKVKSFFSGLRELDLTRGLASSLSWIDDKISELHRWAEGTIETLFERLVEGFDKFSPFVERALEIVQHLISVVADFAKLPPMVVSSAWELIPECIRNPVQDFITQQILARIPVFGQLVAIPDIWEKAQATAMSILRKLFVDGDLGAAAWEFFEAVMKLIGLPPELVTSVLANAAGAVGHILSDPIGFLLNALKAAGQGFSQFVSNAGSHLMNGISGWLFGTLRKGGIEPPADFSLRSILGVVLQILDVTTDRIFERIGERVGPSVTRRMRQMLDYATGAWSFISTLVQEGPGALWEDLREQLSDLGDQVLDSVVSWATTTIVTQAGIRLTPLLAPTGVSNVIAGFMELYRGAKAVASQLEEILTVFDRFLAGVGDIATGSLSQAADFLEQALSQTIPAALGLLANYAGLGNLSERIQEMVESIRGRVDDALDWLIDRAIRLGRGFIDLARRGGRAVRRGARALVNWWQTEREFETDTGEQHTLYVDGEGEQQELIIESTPTHFSTFIEELVLPDSEEENRREVLNLERQLNLRIRAAHQLERAFEEGEKQEAEYTRERDRTRESIQDRLEELIEPTKALIARAENTTDVSPDRASQAPRYGSLRPTTGFGTSVYVPVLSKDHEEGSPASQAPSDSPQIDWWNKLKARKSGGDSYYVKGHLLNEKLGGPAEWDNLTPLTQAANLKSSNSMYWSFEHHVKNAVEPSGNEQGIAVNYIVTARYGSAKHPRYDEIEELKDKAGAGDERAGKEAEIIEAEQHIPESIICESRVVDALGNDKYQEGQSIPESGPVEVDNSFATPKDGYDLVGVPKKTIYLSDSEPDDIAKLDGITDDIAKEIVNTAQTLSDGHYRTHAQVAEKNDSIEPALWQRARESDGFNVLLYRRNKGNSDE